MDKTCATCGLTKPVEQFDKKKSGRYGVSARCKPCQAAYRKTWYDRNAEAARAASRAYFAANKAAMVAKGVARVRARKAADPEYRAQENARSVALARKLRARVFTHYGGDPPRCACCGEQQDVFLTLDHTNGGGGAHRKQVGSKGTIGVLYWLIRNDFPEGYSVLCWNCHMAKDKRGGCPHQRT